MSSVYAVKHEHGFFKIGMSATPIKRYKSLQSVCPYMLELYCILNTTADARELESSIHDELEDSNLHHEWFDTTESEVMDVFRKRLKSDEWDASELQRVKLKKSNQDKTMPTTEFTAASGL